MKQIRQQLGATLIELMIGILVGIIVVAGGLTFYVNIIQGSTHTHRIARLNQETSAIMQLMSSEIRRAGYGVGDDNLFPSGSAAGSESACILYSYLKDDGNLLFSGFKLIGQTIKMKTNGNDMDDCATGTWTDLSDPAMTLVDATDLNGDGDLELFLIEKTVTTGADVRQVWIAIDAESALDANILKQDSIQIRLRNNEY